MVRYTVKRLAGFVNQDHLPRNIVSEIINHGIDKRVFTREVTDFSNVKFTTNVKDKYSRQAKTLKILCNSKLMKRTLNL
ncbi:hypothetical protein A3Q56_05118 [Intoshia linei]|uniref:Uncharacterized protein n=1 Tax=Intoshia linei TaxID=1819745 RepID=A0A177AYQ8_9BILA|nr:hypothetical protein A3Q56_05118 [Intoshia linei]